jgi:hypothetical protein
MNSSPELRPVLSEDALAWIERGLWGLCIGVYLTIFVGGILAHLDELQVMGRAVVFTLMTAVLGKVAVGLLSRASLPVEDEEGPSAEPLGPIGSQIEEPNLTNFAEHEEAAEAA